MQTSREYRRQFEKWLEENGCKGGASKVAGNIFYRIDRPIHSLAFVPCNFFETDLGIQLKYHTPGFGVQDLLVLLHDEERCENWIYSVVLFETKDLAIRMRLQLGHQIHCMWIFTESEVQFSLPYRYYL